MKQALPTVWSYPCPGVLVGFVFTVVSKKQLIFLPEVKWLRSVYHQEFSAGQSLWMHAMERTPWRVYVIQGYQFMISFLRGANFRKGCVMASQSLRLLQIRGCCWGFKLFSQSASLRYYLCTVKLTNFKYMVWWILGNTQSCKHPEQRDREHFRALMSLPIMTSFSYPISLTIFINFLQAWNVPVVMEFLFSQN